MAKPGMQSPPGWSWGPTCRREGPHPASPVLTFLFIKLGPNLRRSPGEKNAVSIAVTSCHPDQSHFQKATCTEPEAHLPPLANKRKKLERIKTGDAGCPHGQWFSDEQTKVGGGHSLRAQDLAEWHHAPPWTWRSRVPWGGQFPQ